MVTAACGPIAPADLAGRGPAEQVFDLAAGKRSGEQLFALGSCLLGVPLSLVIAVPLLICAFKPFGKDAPPPLVCLAIGSVALTAALGAAYGVYFYAGGGRRGAAAYHLYRDGLLIVAPGAEQRWLAWEQLGEEKAPSPWNPQHVFPVEGGRDVVFDQAAADHGALAKALNQKAGQERWAHLLDGQALSTDRPAPYFLVHDRSDNGLYRVSPLAGRLLFLRVADGSAAGTRGFKARNVPVQGGLAGGMAGWAQMKQVERVQQALDALAGADERRLFEAAAGLPGSRLLQAEELTEVHFAAATAWEQLTTGAGVVGMLLFKHPEWGEKKLHFEALQQVGDAARLLQDVLGHDFRSEAVRLAAQA